MHRNMPSYLVCMCTHICVVIWQTEHTASQALGKGACNGIAGTKLYDPSFLAGLFDLWKVPSQKTAP